MADMMIQVVPRNGRDLEVLTRDLAWKYRVQETDYAAWQVYLRGNVLAAEGRHDEAATRYREALGLRSDDPRVYTALAGAMLSLGEHEGAVLVAERAAQMTEQRDPVVLDRLAAAYAAAGRFDEAARTAERGANAASAAGLEDLAVDLRERADRYRVGRPD
jgi:tetratricopeptide (TPR) repeat protein